jgi:hypothetical protein
MPDIKLSIITTVIMALVLIYFGWFVYFFGPIGIFVAFGPILIVALLAMLWVMIYQMVESWYDGKTN